MASIWAPLLLGLALAASPALAQGTMDHHGQGQPGAAMDHHGDGGHPPAGKAAMPNDPASRAYMQSMRAMNKAMTAKPMTGNADRDFATMMMAHHKGAIDMARVELDHGKDPALKAMAQKMIDDQTREIKELQDWLDQHPAAK